MEEEALEDLSDIGVDWQYVRFTKCYTNQEEARKRKSRQQSLSESLKSIHSKPEILGKKRNRNPKVVCVTFWEGVKPEGQFTKAAQRIPTVPAAVDGDLTVAIASLFS